MLIADTIASRTVLPQPPSGWFDYGFAVLMDGRLALVRTMVDVHAEWRSRVAGLGGAQSQGKKRAPAPKGSPAIRLSIFDGIDETGVTTVSGVHHPIVDRLADGRWIVVAARCGPKEANAGLFNANGDRGAAFHIGDAVQHIQCAPDGTIWVGYFDEGACGGGAAPSSGGIVQFDPSGDALWSYNSQDGSGPNVCDCYAMTLSGTVMWASTYVDFPISRRTADQTNIWSNQVAGARGIAAHADIVVLAGGYSEDRPRVAVVRLTEVAGEELGSLRFDAMENAAMIQGRDGVLHVVSERVWYRMSVERAAEAVLAAPVLWKDRSRN